MISESTMIKDWYLKEYQSDELGNMINGHATFYDLFRALDTYQCIYELLGVADSLVRERVFQALSDVMNCGYSDIYDQWLINN